MANLQNIVRLFVSFNSLRQKSLTKTAADAIANFLIVLHKNYHFGGLKTKQS